MKKIILLLILIIPIQISPHNKRNLKNPESLKIQILKLSPLTLSNLESYIHLLNIQHPTIVIKQAILETGWLSSRVCKTHNNLFGLVYNGRYAKFSHWTESVKAYKNFQNKRYNSGCYYTFLKRRGYASDRNYIKKLKSIKV